MVVLALGGAGACESGPDVTPLPPPPTVPETTTTTVVDFGTVSLPAVAGRTTTTLAMTPGQATLSGAVAGPEGPVEGALVRVERLVGDARTSTDVLTLPDGTWSLPGVLGGRYRVRAWRQPDLALTVPEIFFLNATEVRTVTLALTRYAGFNVATAVAPDPPLVFEAANLAVQVTNRGVDENGIVRSSPVRTTAELYGAGDWRVQSTNPTQTDATGTARWRLVCRRVGPQPLAVLLGDGQTFNITVSPCGAAPPSPGEAPADGDGDGSGDSTTTTTRRTTTTAAPGTTRPVTTTTERSTTTTARSSGTTNRTTTTR